MVVLFDSALTRYCSEFRTILMLSFAVFGQLGYSPRREGRYEGGR
jgi:hypothetical protein